MERNENLTNHPHTRALQEAARELESIEFASTERWPNETEEEYAARFARTASAAGRAYRIITAAIGQSFAGPGVPGKPRRDDGAGH